MLLRVLHQAHASSWLLDGIWSCSHFPLYEKLGAHPVAVYSEVPPRTP
jgi:hypothetical protein